MFEVESVYVSMLAWNELTAEGGNEPQSIASHLMTHVLRFLKRNFDWRFNLDAHNEEGGLGGGLRWLAM